MSAEETPPQRFELVVAPSGEENWDEFAASEAELYTEVFQSICEKMWSLGINTSRPSLFSTYVDGEWVRLLSVQHQVRIGGVNGVNVPGQRLIINRTQTNNSANELSISTSDYLLCFEKGSMFRIDSELFRSSDHSVWDVNAGSGPLIEPKSDKVNLHYGIRYQQECFNGRLLTLNDALLANTLLRSLQMFGPAYQDEVTGVKFQTYNNL